MDEDLQMLRGRLVLHAERLRDADDRGTPRLFQELQNPQTPRARDGFQLLLEGRREGMGECYHAVTQLYNKKVVYCSGTLSQ